MGLYKSLCPSISLSVGRYAEWVTQKIAIIYRKVAKYVTLNNKMLNPEAFAPCLTLTIAITDYTNELQLINFPRADNKNNALKMKLIAMVPMG